MFTPEEFRHIAQGCRASRLPWVRVANDGTTLKGLRPLRTKGDETPLGACLRSPWSLRSRWPARESLAACVGYFSDSAFSCPPVLTGTSDKTWTGPTKVIKSSIAWPTAFRGLTTFAARIKNSDDRHHSYSTDHSGTLEMCPTTRNAIMADRPVHPSDHQRPLPGPNPGGGPKAEFRPVISSALSRWSSLFLSQCLV